MRHHPALPAQCIRRIPALFGTRSIGFVFLALLMLLMPISYRAGTEAAHAHTILQGIIDGITGHSHHHPGESAARAAESPVVSPFAPATVPLGSLAVDGSETSEPGATTGHGTDDGQASAPTGSDAPDLPERLGLYSPIESTSAIHELGALIALLLAGAVRTAPWGKANRLFQVCITQDPPPPRPAS